MKSGDLLLLLLCGIILMLVSFLALVDCPEPSEQNADYRNVFMAGAQYAILVYDTTAHHPTEEQLNAGADSLENGTWQQHLEEIANQ